MSDRHRPDDGDEDIRILGSTDDVDRLLRAGADKVGVNTAAIARPELVEEIAARFGLVKGFAGGRTIFADAARAWLKGEMSDSVAIAQMADRFARLCGIWDKARAAAA